MPENPANPASGSNVPRANSVESIKLISIVSVVAGAFLYLMFEILRGRRTRMCRSLYRQRSSLRYRKINPRLRVIDMPKYPRGFLAWAIQCWQIDDEKFLELVGLDGYMAIRFIRLCCRLCWCATIFGCGILIPIYSTGPRYTKNDESVFFLTMVNLENGSQKLWATVIFAWIFTFYLLYELRSEHMYFSELRNDWLASGDLQSQRQAAYTVIVENIPPTFRSPVALADFFNTLFPRQVHSVSVCLNLRDLERLVLKRNAAVQKLKYASNVSLIKGADIQKKFSTKRFPWKLFCKNREEPTQEYYGARVAKYNQKLRPRLRAKLEAAAILESIKREHLTKLHLDQENMALYFCQELGLADERSAHRIKSQRKAKVKGGIKKSSINEDSETYNKMPLPPGNPARYSIMHDISQRFLRKAADPNNFALKEAQHVLEGNEARNKYIEQELHRASHEIEHFSQSRLRHRTNVPSFTPRGTSTIDCSTKKSSRNGSKSKRKNSVGLTICSEDLTMNNWDSMTNSLKKSHHSEDSAIDNLTCRRHTIDELSLEDEIESQNLLKLSQSQSLSTDINLKCEHLASLSVVTLCRKDNENGESLNQYWPERALGDETPLRKESNFGQQDDLEESLRSFIHESETSEPEGHRTLSSFFSWGSVTAPHAAKVNLFAPLASAVTGAGKQVACCAKDLGNEAIRGAQGVAEAVKILTVGSMSATAFVTFKTLGARLSTVQAVVVGQPDMFIVTPAPEPRDLIWANVTRHVSQIEYRQHFINVLVAIGLFFWASVVAGIQALTSPESLNVVVPGIQEYALKHPLISQLLTAYLPVLLLLILLQNLYIIFKFLAKRVEGYKSESEAERAVIDRYFYFQLANVYVTVTAGSIFRAAEAIIKEPSAILSLLGGALPNVAVYFTNLVITKMVAGLMMELCFGGRPLKFFRILCIEIFTDPKLRTPEDRTKGVYDPSEPWYGRLFSDFLLILMVVFVYQCIAPFVALAGLVYFSLATIVYKYQLLHCYWPLYESGGQYFYKLYRQVVIGSVAGLVTLLGYMSIRLGFEQGPFLVPLPFIVLIVGFKWTDEGLYASRLLSLDKAAVQDREDELAETRGYWATWETFEETAYQQPELKDALHQDDSVSLNSNMIDDSSDTDAEGLLTVDSNGRIVRKSYADKDIELAQINHNTVC